jgi:AcrR family transcriptional regulator
MEGADHSSVRATTEDLPLVQRKQLAARRRAQESAFELLGSTSFDDVTVERIAADAEVSPSTIYRYFGTKEGVFLWDEYDEAVVETFRERLATLPPGAAMLQAVAGAFDGQQPELGARVLDRMRMIEATPQLRAARAAEQGQLRRTLAAVIVESGWREPEASTFAGAVVGAFTGAIEAWERSGGTDDLGCLVARTAEVVGALDRLFSTMHEH